MRILIFTSSGNKSGGSRQALYLAQGLAGRGHEVRLFTTPDAQLRSLDPQASFWRDLTPGAWRACLEAEMPAGAPCVVHAFHNKAVKCAAWWGISWHERAVVVAHRGVLFRPKNPLPYWSPGIDGFLVNSKACAGVIRTWGVSRKRLFCVPNSVPDERLACAGREAARTELGFAPDDFVFGCVAGDNPNKGAEVLLKAFALAFSTETNGPKLLISGLGYQAPFELHRELNLGDNVRLEGPTEAVALRLAAMDAFVLPSLSESMPNTLLEAVRFGLPAIGSGVGAVPEILETCGLVVPPGNVEALAQALRRLYDDVELRAGLREAACAAREAYAPDKRLDLVESIYAELMRRKFPGATYA